MAQGNAPCARQGTRRARSALCAHGARWLGLSVALLGVLGCEKGPALSQSEQQSFDWGLLHPEGPRLGALADVTPIFASPDKTAAHLGYLHAGAQVARSENARTSTDCPEGWYAIHPRGYVCTEQSATTELDHPTLHAMSLGPYLERPLPYTYAHTTRTTSLFDPKEGDGVAQSGHLARGAGLAVVGSWTAPDESHEPQRLGLLMNGQFVRADDLRAAEASTFAGANLSESLELPLAFVVKRGVRAFKLADGEVARDEELAYHTRLELTGRFRTVGETRFWALRDDRWVRHQDVTVLRRRNDFPDFATGEQRWVDVSVITGTAVVYRGKRAEYATLVSVGRDRLGDPQSTASTPRGTFRVTAKSITRRAENPLASQDGPARYDVPWSLELEGGASVHGAYWHDRFGIEHSDGAIELSPADAAYLFRWATPELPEGWHSVRAEVQSADSTLFLIR